MTFSTKLIAITQGAGELSGKSAEEVITYAARVSNPDNQMSFESAPKLLKYCIKHKHYSIFEQAFMTIEIKTSRAIAAQILRHRSFVFQEYSQRYSATSSFEETTARRQDKKNRQSSIDDLSVETQDFFKTAQNEIWKHSYDLYTKALELGIAKECARFLLPLSTSTTMYMTGSARSWIHYIDLRTDEATQKEHRDIAEGCKQIFKQQFPSISEALEW